MIFLHGGPGYNSASFELSTARRLSDSGYFVIVYDSRGTGRSAPDSAKFTFQSETDDLLSILDRFQILKVSLLGHSFGGAVALKFASKYPERVSSVVLIGAPLNYPQTFRTILRRCRKIYERKGDTASLPYINILDTMDSFRLDYANYCLMHAMYCRLYSPKVQTTEAKEISARMKADSQVLWLRQNNPFPVQGFYKNEAYTTLDLQSDAKAVKSKVQLAGIYGEEDGLFDDDQIRSIRELIGGDKFHLVPGASHSVFIDQQSEFLAALKKLLDSN